MAGINLQAAPSASAPSTMRASTSPQKGSHQNGGRDGQFAVGDLPEAMRAHTEAWFKANRSIFLGQTET